MSLSEALCHAACQFFGMFHALDFPEDPQYLRKTIELCHHQLSIWKQSSIFHLLQKHVANPDTVSNILYRLLLLLQLATGRLLLALVPRDLPVPDHLHGLVGGNVTAPPQVSGDQPLIPSLDLLQLGEVSIVVGVGVRRRSTWAET